MSLLDELSNVIEKMGGLSKLWGSFQRAWAGAPTPASNTTANNTNAENTSEKDSITQPNMGEINKYEINEVGPRNRALAG